jgi:hypothetical protein
MIVAPSQTRPGDLALLKIPLTLAARKAPAFLQSDDCLENILSSPTPKELRLLISPPDLQADRDMLAGLDAEYVTDAPSV